MSRPLKAGVIGLGIGERHIVGYQSIPNVEVKAVCDINPAQLAEVADRRDIRDRYTDWRPLVADPEIDVVSICSYDDAHAEQVVGAFQNGKHVFVEKPLALHPRESEAILEAWQESGSTLQMSSNLILRRSPRFIDLKARLQAGAFGRITYVEGDYLHQILHKITEGWRGKMPFYCVTYGGGIHLIDLMRWLIDDEIVEVSSMGTTVLAPESTYRYPDLIVSLLRFAGGALGKSVTHFAPTRTKFHALRLYGTERTFINDLPHGQEFTGDDPEHDVHQNTVPYPAMEKGDLLPDFVEALQHGRPPLVTMSDVFRVMDVCFACWSATESGRTTPVRYLLPP
ncbi:MAG: Gfo/Idh/MocA family protein [Bradymonadia bacterium]